MGLIKENIQIRIESFELERVFKLFCNAQNLKASYIAEAFGSRMGLF